MHPYHFTAQKSALTRAVRTGNREALVAACRKAVNAWDEPGNYWPDDWSRWQRALDDAFPPFEAPRLEVL